MRSITLIIVNTILSLALSAQQTSINPARLLKPSGTASQMLVTNGSGATTWGGLNDVVPGTTNQTLRHNGTSWAAVSNLRVPDAVTETNTNMLWRKTNHNNIFLNKGSTPVPIITGSTFTSLTLGAWSPNVLHIPEMGDVLWGPNWARWTKTTTGSNAAGGNTYVIRYVANVANVMTATGGVLYPWGKMYFGYYYTWRPASISVRMKNSSGTWYGPWAVDMTQGDNADPDLNPVYSINIGGFSSEITEVEITHITRNDVITSPEFINWFVNTPQYLRGSRFFDKGLGVERLFSTIEWADNSAVIKASISPSLSYFLTNLGVGTDVPTAKLDVNGTARFRNVIYDANNLTGSVGSVLTNGTGAGPQWANPNALGVSTIYVSNGTLNGNRTVTTGDYTLTIDASTATTNPFSPLIVKGKSSNPTIRYLEGQDETGNWRLRISAGSIANSISSNGRSTTIDGLNYIRLYTTSGAENTWTLRDDQTTAWTARSTDPGTPASFSMWANSSDGRFKYVSNTTIRTISDVERDIVGTELTITAATHTLSGTDYTTRYDANANAITVTLGGSMLDGYEYTVRCTRNATNTVTLNAEATYSLAISGDSALTPTTFVSGGTGSSGFSGPYNIYHMKRKGSIIYIY